MIEFWTKVADLIEIDSAARSPLLTFKSTGSGSSLHITTSLRLTS
jgi:hypothetical protein